MHNSVLILLSVLFACHVSAMCLPRVCLPAMCLPCVCLPAMCLPCVCHVSASLSLFQQVAVATASNRLLPIATTGHATMLTDMHQGQTQLKVADWASILGSTMLA